MAVSLPLSCLSFSPSRICHSGQRRPWPNCGSQGREVQWGGGQRIEHWSQQTIVLKSYPSISYIFIFFSNELIMIYKKAFCTLSNSFCWDQPTKAFWNCTCGTRVLAVGKVWPRAGRVAAHPWMTRPTRPEGTDNGQSLLTLPLCQNVSTFNNVTSTPYMVKHRETIPILWSRELWIGYRWRGVVGRWTQAALNLWPKALSSFVSPVEHLSSLTHIKWPLSSELV